MKYNVDVRIAALHQLGVLLASTSDQKLDAAISRARAENAWFTNENIRKSIAGIVQQFLQQDKLTSWLRKYNIQSVSPKRVGLILAGNIPLVGFHDLLCVYLSGHQAVVKYSSKDAVLVKYIVELLTELDPQAAEQITFIERLENYQAVIATGSNNTSKYFEEYFKHVPHIIRKNRNGIAVIHGDETEADFVKLGEDIFTYFGLGCRNVSKIYVPKDYKFDLMLQTLHDHYKELVLHHKYKNNFDYNHALFMLNKDKFLMSGSLMVRENNAIQSRISSVNYEYYDDVEKLADDLTDQLDDIQCVVSKKAVGKLAVFALGEAQKPSLTDYADGVDTMQFLRDL